MLYALDIVIDTLHSYIDDTFVSILLHFLACYDATPIVIDRITECFARDSNPATVPRMVQQSGALSITPFCLPS